MNSTSYNPQDFPAANGEVVKEKHARICAERGHAVHMVNGVDTGSCPRCGQVTSAPIATGPTSFQPAYPGSTQYLRADAPGWVLLHRSSGVVEVYGPADAPGASSSVLTPRRVVHTVAVIDGDVDDAIAAASAAVDHMMGR